MADSAASDDELVSKQFMPEAKGKAANRARENAELRIHWAKDSRAVSVSVVALTRSLRLHSGKARRSTQGGLCKVKRNLIEYCGIIYHWRLYSHMRQFGVV